MATYRNIRKVLNLPTLSASPSSGVNGEMYFNTTDLALFIYDGEWKKVTQSATTPTYDWTTTAQQAKIVSSDLQVGDDYGYSVALEGDTAVVGARYEDTGGTSAGSVYVFTRSGTSWSQQAKLNASDAAGGDYFGHDVAISGNTVVVGAEREGGTSNDGAAYVFTRSGTSWSQQAKIQSSDIEAADLFGNDVAISGDTVVVGAHYEDTGGSSAGSVYVFTRSGT